MRALRGVPLGCDLGGSELPTSAVQNTCKYSFARIWQTHWWSIRILKESRHDVSIIDIKLASDLMASTKRRRNDKVKLESPSKPPVEKTTLMDAFDKLVRELGDEYVVDIPHGGAEDDLYGLLLSGFEKTNYAAFTEGDCLDETHLFHPDAFKEFKDIMRPYYEAYKEAEDAKTKAAEELVQAMINSKKMRRFRVNLSSEDDSQ